MKKLALATIFVLTQALALSAFAQEKTRAEVKAERDAAAKAAGPNKGEANKGEVSATPVAKSEKARADVKAETKAAAKSGELAKNKGEAGKQ